MTDEKKPPCEVALVKKSGAQIVLDIDSDDQVWMSVTCWNAPDSAYPRMSDDRLLIRTLPIVLAELRLQLKLGRRITAAERDAIKNDLVNKAKDALLIAQTNLAVLQLARISGHP